MGLSGVSNDSNCADSLIIHRMIVQISVSQSDPFTCVCLADEVRWPDYPVMGGTTLMICQWNHPYGQTDDGWTWAVMQFDSVCVN